MASTKMNYLKNELGFINFLIFQTNLLLHQDVAQNVANIKCRKEFFLEPTTPKCSPIGDISPNMATLPTAKV
jgi:hypothetical protein